MPYIVANEVQESCSDTSVGIYEVSVAQLIEIKANDVDGWVTVNDLSFDWRELPEVSAPFTGKIELIVTFYED